MAKMGPSKLVKEIDAYFPNLAQMERIGWSHEHQTWLSNVLILHDRLAKEQLASLSEDDETLLDRALLEVRGVVDTWKGMDIKALKLFGKPTLERQANLGNRNALQVIRDTLDKIPDKATTEDAPKASVPKLTAFISYSHEDRKYGAQARKILAEMGTEPFLAHDDLNVSDEWRERILLELRRCDIFVPLLSKAFMASTWAPQELGFVVSRPEVLVAPLSIDDTTSPGFIRHLQSRRISPDGITRDLLAVPLSTRFPRTILPALIRIAGAAAGWRDAEAKMAPLVPLFPLFTPQEAQVLAAASVANGQVWSAFLCRTQYLPEFIRVQGNNVQPETLRALRYQVEHEKPYPGDVSEG